MARRSNSSALLLLTCGAPFVIHTHNMYVLGVWMAAQGTALGFQMHSYIKGDPEAERERRLAASRQKTAELEKDLGMEPLNLHELDPILLDEQRRDRGA